MYIEWDGDPDHLELVTSMALGASGEKPGEWTAWRIYAQAADGLRCVLFEGTEKAARTVFCAIRKRLGLSGTFITTKWMRKVADGAGSES